MKTNHSINTFRLIAAFFIVCIHSFAGYNTPFNDIVSGLSRFAVPIFLMITGYFLYDSDYYLSLDHFKKQIMNFLKLTVKYTSIYLFVSLFFTLFTNSISLYLQSLFTPTKLLEFLFLNQSHINESLWYLSACLYAIFIFYFLIQSKIRNYLIPCSIILLVIHLALGTYSFYTLGYELPYIFTRNFLFMALPFLMIGYTLNQYSKVIRDKTTTATSILLIVFSLVGVICEILFSSYFLTITNKELYFFTILFSVSLFILSIVKPNIGKDTMAPLGRKYALYIYLLHPWLVAPIRNLFINPLGIYAPFITTIITFGICLLLAMLLYKVGHRKKRTRSFKDYY